MNKKEAYKILGLEYGASEEEIKKQFKKLTKEKHPDLNKGDTAEEFTKISSAFTYLKNPPPEPKQSGFGGFNPFQGVNISDFFNPFKNTRRHKVKALQTSVNISFKEAVRSCKKKIYFDRDIYCTTCIGNGSVPSNDTCNKCNGSGFIENNSVVGNRQIRMKAHCIVCNATGKQSKECSKCSGSGTSVEKCSLDIKIPGGVLDKQVMRLSRMGNLNTDAYLIINVASAHNMSISGKNVMSNISISLLEALKGTKKNVKTVFGDKKIKIKPNIKHKDSIKLKGLGVEKKGDHIFVVDIEYPEDTKDLIEILEKGDL